MQGELFNVRYCAHEEQKIAAGVSWVSSSVLSACLPARSNFSCEQHSDDGHLYSPLKGICRCQRGRLNLDVKEPPLSLSESQLRHTLFPHCETACLVFLVTKIHYKNAQDLSQTTPPL